MKEIKKQKKKTNDQTARRIKLQLEIIVFNLICYGLIFIVLALSTVFIIHTAIMSTAEDSIKNALDKIDDAQERDGVIDWLTINNSEKRMTVELLDENGGLIANVGFLRVRNDSILKLDEFTLITASYFVEGEPPSPNNNGSKVYLLAYSTDVDWIYSLRESPNQVGSTVEVDRAIFYMDVSSELAIRSRVIRIYIVSVSIILLLAFIVSFFGGKVAVRPIVEALQKQTDFVSDASHELRTPLAIIQSKLENVLSHSDKTVMDMSDDLAVTLNEVIRLSKLTNNLLTLSRGDRETIQLDLEELDVYDLVLQTAEPFVETSMLSNKTIEFDCDHIVAMVDKDKITQVLVILLDNAIRYTDEGDKIIVSLKRNKDEFVLSVKDTGIGISEETRLHMFERFYREDKARNRETGGRGLGLAIAKVLVTTCDGKIVADHNHPKGTIMSMHIPINKGKIEK